MRGQQNSKPFLMCDLKVDQFRLRIVGLKILQACFEHADREPEGLLSYVLLSVIIITEICCIVNMQRHI